jgi:two-component system invasion response regulator UvrY
MLVDDSAVVLGALIDMAVAAGFSVVATAASGEEALTLFELHRPDAVLLDVRLAGISGLAVADRISAAYPATRVVLISATDHNDRVLRKCSLTPALLREAFGLSAFQ